MKTKNLLENPLYWQMPNEKNAIIQHLGVINGYSVDIKREDLIHPLISGNKWRKLKYNISFAKSQNIETIITFGGAFSNHIFSTAAAGKLLGFKTVGIIRGDEIKDLNTTLSFAKNCGMDLRFVSREDYRLKNESLQIQNIINEFENAIILPEGGTNSLAMKGTSEILTKEEYNFYDYICCACGTGGTIAGLIYGNKLDSSKILGFSALKGDFLTNEVIGLLKQISNDTFYGWEINNEFHFGGYAKTNEVLLRFIESFKLDYNIELDPIYTGKMAYGVFEMIKNKQFTPNSKILIIHTGGLRPF